MRKYTNMVLNMLPEGMSTMSAQDIAEMCLAYMSEDDVRDMCRANDLFPEEDEEDEDDGQPDEAQEWESFDVEC